MPEVTSFLKKNRCGGNNLRREEAPACHSRKESRTAQVNVRDSF